VLWPTELKRHFSKF